jgi:hypothetical protein
MGRIYEAWRDPDDWSVTLLQAGEADAHRAKGLLGPAAVLLYRFEAATLEEASAIHALRMGWAPYRPVGAPAECPACGAIYYPRGQWGVLAV